MTSYTALIDGEDGAYGVYFPDLPGCVAMGASIDEAVVNAAEAMRDWVDVAVGGAARFPSRVRSRPCSPTTRSPRLCVRVRSCAVCRWS